MPKLNDPPRKKVHKKDKEYAPRDYKTKPLTQQEILDQELKEKMKGLPVDICQNCCRCFAHSKSKRSWCWWCENPPTPKKQLPTPDQLTYHGVPVSKLRKQERDAMKPSPFHKDKIDKAEMDKSVKENLKKRTEAKKKSFGNHGKNK